MTREVITSIRDLMKNGLLENAITIMRDHWHTEGTVLRARLSLLERERASGRITADVYNSLREKLAHDVLEELDELERRHDGS